MPLFVYLLGYVFSCKGGYYSGLIKSLQNLIIPYCLFFIINYVINWGYEKLFFHPQTFAPSFSHKLYKLVYPIYGTGVANGIWFLLALFWIQVTLCQLKY